ncbi:hypothetical protein HA052_05040 [Chromobacterium haemolyticum]|uniref:Uncharacterized protein n=1 Tax=Chromobacterium fluminis TaxID=3044269 RepID=A0ABX0L4J0_9NEIS|nr:hypothetical protein [Chromobacterium haemolyticum]NHR04557.1 hypothetical protein [Chromobacterium haemolyticum]
MNIKKCLQKIVNYIPGRVVLSVAPIIMLVGCTTVAPFDKTLVGTKQLGLVVSVNDAKILKQANQSYQKEYGTDIPKTKDAIFGALHNGFWEGGRWFGGLADAGQIEVGDIVEWNYPASKKEFAVIKLVTKWNDPNPNGCYWKGSLDSHNGDVVCDNSPDAPRFRQEAAKWLKSKDK